MARNLAYRCAPEVVQSVTGKSGSEAAVELAARLAPALEAAQRALIAGRKGARLVRDNELFIAGNGAIFYAWAALPQLDGTVMVVLSHPVLPSGVAWTPDLQEEAPLGARKAVLEVLGTVEGLPPGELCYAVDDDPS